VPTFGVPCPTAILTIGLLLTARGPASTWLIVAPALWGFVAGSAVLLFGVWSDYPLLAAAVLATADVISQVLRRSANKRSGRGTGDSHEPFTLNGLFSIATLNFALR